MERLQKPQERRERTGVLQIILITAVLLAALYGGLRLLGATHAAWNDRQEKRSAYATAIREASERANEKEHERVQMARIEAVRREQREYDEAIRDGRLRCINGQLFRRLDNGWANIPGQGCQ